MRLSVDGIDVSTVAYMNKLQSEKSMDGPADVIRFLCSFYEEYRDDVKQPVFTRADQLSKYKVPAGKSAVILAMGGKR